MRILHAVFLLSVLLIFQQAEQLAGARTRYSMVFLAAIVFVAGIDGLLALYFRRKKLLPASEKLRRFANDTNALKEWRLSTLLILTLTESIALYGLVLRVMGASRRVSWPFFVTALILIVAWRPQLDFGSQAPDT